MLRRARRAIPLCVVRFCERSRRGRGFRIDAPPNAYLMPRTCTICRHEKRQEIDEALVAGEAFRNIAKRFESSWQAVRRHKEHLSVKLVKAAERREDRHANSLIDQVDALAARTKALLDEVFPEQKQKGQKVNPRDVAAAVREVRETLRLTAQ